MASKLATAKFVTMSGQCVAIAWGRGPDILPRLASGENVGTLFLPQPKTFTSKKRWIGFSAQPAGRVQVDEGAAKAMCVEGRSLLAIESRPWRVILEKAMWFR